MNTRQICVAAALVFYALSLAFPSFQCGVHGSFYGWYVLLLGWMGLLALDPSWFINIPFLVMVVALASNWIGRNRILPIATSLAAISEIFMHPLGCLAGGGAPGVASGLGIGGYFWVASIVIVSMAYIAHRPAALPNERTISDIAKGPAAPQKLQRRLRLVRWGGLIASLAAYSLSLSLPAFACATTRSATGLDVLMTGWAGPLSAGFHEYRWYLNVALFLVLWYLASDNVRLSRFVPMAAALLSLTALLPGAPGCLSNGAPGPSLGLAAGGYLWVASFFAGSLAYIAYQRMRAGLSSADSAIQSGSASSLAP